MRNTRSFNLFLLISILAVTFQPAAAQVVIATVPVGTHPISVAVNPVTNKTYVANICGNDPNCANPGTVTVIDGVTNKTATIAVGVRPYAVAVNSVTNQIYVANSCGNNQNCQSTGTVTVIDGATNKTTSVTVGRSPLDVEVNPATNQIYVPNFGDNTVTVIDGSTNNTSTVSVGVRPHTLAVDAVTNQIYVVNNCGNDAACKSTGTVTVINGATNGTSTVNVGAFPNYIGLNAATNKIYVENNCGNDLTCKSAGTVTVIDGTTNGTSTVPVGVTPDAVTVDPVSNKIYVPNYCGTDINCASIGTVTVIDGATNTTANVLVGFYPAAAAVDAVTNKIYVPNYCGTDSTCKNPGTVSVIDGATNNTASVAVGFAPDAVAVNATTNRVYVVNYIDATVSVIGGVNATALQFVTVTPCRVVDTRNANGQFGGPPIQGQTSRSFPIPQQTSCNIPSTAAAYSLNVTLVPIQNGPVSYLTIWPAGEDQPVVSIMNSLDGRIKANAAIVPAGYQEAVSVYVTDTTNVVIDIDGYFAAPSGQSLQFHPLVPCRVLDTRNANGDLGGPYLQGGQERDFPVLESTCIPSNANAVAYSMNFTVVPVQGQPLGYLTVWPTGESQPKVSTLNNLTGTIVANAAILPAGTGGAISVYPSNSTHLVGDIDGFFAAPGESGLSLYPGAPCRVIDTRKIGSGQPFSGTLSPPVDVVDSSCGIPSTAQAYVFNATVIPQVYLGYLTLWPDGEQKPVVSTLNAADGAITSHMAIVPNLGDGKTDAYASGTTQLILDISSYFAP